MPSAPQAGKSARSLSASGIMTSNTFIKGTGILQVLPLGLLLLSLLVSGFPAANAADAPSTISQMTSDSSSTTSGVSTTSLSPGTTTTTQSPTTTAISTGTASTTTTTTQSPATTTTSGSSASTTTTTQSPATTTTSGSSASTTTQSSTTTAISTDTASTTTTKLSTPTSGGSPSTGGMTWNGTTMSNNTSNNMIYCPSFSCNSSDCWSMYTSQNTTPCAADAFCQLLRQTDMLYTASCSRYCSGMCMNISQTNCTVNCCNSTGCLNSTFASMMMITTTVFRISTTATSPAPTTTTTTQTTTVNKGNRCHNGTCTGAKCFTSFNSFLMCSSSQPHCQLKNESTDSTIKWTASCTNCTGSTACISPANAPCILECCNATMNSCLWLNGTLNVPSFATRGPYLHTELIVCLLCAVAITFLL